MLHMEDGSYKTISSEEVYNNMKKDYANKDIIDLLEVKYFEADGKALYQGEMTYRRGDIDWCSSPES